MARTSTYLNFTNKTEEAFLFYQSAFESEFVPPGFRRFRDIPPAEGQPPIPETLANLVMHVELPITGGHIIMGTDAPEEMGFSVVRGNQVSLNLEPDSRAEADRLLQALSEGGSEIMPMQEQFWGAYFGGCTDRYGIRWMVNCYAK